MATKKRTLTKFMREVILGRILRDTLRERAEEIVSREAKLADMAYEDRYPKEIRAKMALLPSDFFQATNYVYVKNIGHPAWHHSSPGRAFYPMLDELVGEKSRSVVRGFTMSNARLVGYRDVVCTSGWTLSADVTALFEQYLKDCQTLLADYSALKTQITAALNSVKTVEALIEVWPDCKRFIPAEETHIIGLPAVRVEDLNTLINTIKNRATAKIEEEPKKSTKSISAELVDDLMTVA